MSKLTIKEILDIPQLSFYLEPHEFSFFTSKVRDFETIANLYNAEKVDALMNMNGSMYSEYEGLENANIDANFIQERLNAMPDTRDSQVTKAYADSMKSVLISNSKMVNRDSLLLFLGGLASKYLKDVSTPNKFTEIVYTNGDIINVKNDNAIKKDAVVGKQKTSIKELKESLAEGILITFRELQENLKRNKNFSVRGTYLGRGLNASPEKISFNLEELESVSRSKLVFDSLGIEKIKELHSQKLITYSDLIKAASNNQISRTDVLLLYKEGILKRDDILKKVFKQKDFTVSGKQEDLDIKLLLYTIGEIDINTLEKNFRVTEKAKEKEVSIEFLKKISKYYEHKKIGELLTHNVLNYAESKAFLEVLIEDKVINKSEQTYFEKLMEDFKCNELLNQVEVEGLEKTENIGKRYQHRAGITIDPQMRLSYLESIGSVKRVKVNGQMWITEDEKSRKKSNSLDGYELLIIPDKKVAILEKFYEVTRDSNGNIQYKKNEKGEYIPAISNATYIMPIGLAKDLVENKNKKDLIQSRFVHRSFHTADWVNATESKCLRINPEIEFEKQNTNIWAKKISENYKKNKEIRSL